MPGRFSQLKETYRIVSMQRASAGAMFGVGARGDAFLKVSVDTVEAPHPAGEVHAP